MGYGGRKWVKKIYFYAFAHKTIAFHLNFVFPHKSTEIGDSFRKTFAFARKCTAFHRENECSCAKHLRSAKKFCIRSQQH